MVSSQVGHDELAVRVDPLTGVRLHVAPHSGQPVLPGWSVPPPTSGLPICILCPLLEVRGNQFLLNFDRLCNMTKTLASSRLIT